MFAQLIFTFHQNEGLEAASRSRPGVMIGLENGLYHILYFRSITLVKTEHVVVDETYIPARNINMRYAYSPSALNLDSMHLSEKDNTSRVALKRQEKMINN